LLEVGANATVEEIETSYQRIASYLDASSLAMYSMMEEDEVGRMRAAVDQAYYTLTDPQRRAAYDRALSEGGEYFPVMVPEMQTDSTLSVGTVGDGAGALPPRSESVPPAPGVATQASAPAASLLPPASALATCVESSLTTSVESPPVTSVESPQPARRVRRLATPPDVDLGPDTEFSGALLRRLRESTGASLADLGEITKISKRYLNAIEENDFSALPAAVYVRGFVSEYARALGLNSRVVAASYMALYQRYKREGNR
jgi:curved DNA-binding protein CbpA